MLGGLCSVRGSVGSPIMQETLQICMRKKRSAKSLLRAPQLQIGQLKVQLRDPPDATDRQRTTQYFCIALQWQSCVHQELKWQCIRFCEEAVTLQLAHYLDPTMRCLFWRTHSMAGSVGKSIIL